MGGRASSRAATPRASRSARRGQTMIFIIFALVIGALLVLFNADLHRTIFAKFVSQNAGDSAALAAARWQGATLNLIGDLNVLKAVAVSRNDPDTVNTLTELQKRLNFVGPMAGLVAAQQAAKNNGIFDNPDFKRILLEHAQVVRTEYPSKTDPNSGQLLFPEPWIGAWRDYADMIEMVANDGVAAAPDNARYYTDFTGGHMLLRLDFYNAVASADWCWFLHHAMTLLRTYQNYHSWPPLPPQVTLNHPVNCEYFGLGLACASGTVSKADGTIDAINVALDERRPSGVRESVITNQTLTAAWFWFDPGAWTAWSGFSPADGEIFPAKGSIKPQYNYLGADSVVRIQTEFDRLTPSVSNAAITWTAAAKAFGCMTNDQAMLERPDTLSLVLPVFSEVRLFPVDVSTAPEGGAFNIAWREHIEKHLTGWTDYQGYHSGYAQYGPGLLNTSCFYCRQLVRWEDPLFRGTGIQWLAQPGNAAKCQLTGGGGGPGGGTHRGH